MLVIERSSCNPFKLLLLILIFLRTLRVSSGTHPNEPTTIVGKVTVLPGFCFWTLVFSSAYLAMFLGSVSFIVAGMSIEHLRSAKIVDFL